MHSQGLSKFNSLMFKIFNPATFLRTNLSIKVHVIMKTEENKGLKIHYRIKVSKSKFIVKVFETTYYYLMIFVILDCFILKRIINFFSFEFMKSF